MLAQFKNLNYNQQNIFAKIIRGEISCKKVYEDDFMLVFYDIKPVAPVHLLAIPKGEYCNFTDFTSFASNEEILHFFRISKDIANQYSINGFRIITNNGKDATQTVEHFHLHIIAGKKMDQLIAD